MTEWDMIAIRIFVDAGIAYYILGTINLLKWWHGSDENGNPK